MICWFRESAPLIMAFLRLTGPGRCAARAESSKPRLLKRQIAKEFIVDRAVQTGTDARTNQLPKREEDGRMVSPADFLDRLRNNIASVFLGKPDAIQWVLASLLAEGHVLIEDVPGIGKTLLARALASSLGCTFHRIQFTPDLLPSDIIGTTVFHQTNTEFVFKPGPLFAQVVLADEINRTTPRTQSALLEAMNDRQVSVDGVSRPLGPPFIVLATQNPYEFEGTYPLPESQLDRFMIRLRMGYPIRSEERKVLVNHRQGEPVESLSPVLIAEEVLRLQRGV